MERILVRRAVGVEILRRGDRVVALSDGGPWRALSPQEHRLLVETERPQVFASLRSLGVTPDGIIRLYQARLISFNGRMRPPLATSPPTPIEIPRVAPSGLEEIDGIALVDVDLTTPLSQLLPAMERGVCVIPVLVAARPGDFTAGFERLADAGFRLMRLEPAPTVCDDDARALAHGYVDMLRAALRYAEVHPARFRISGLDGWLTRLTGIESPFVPPHPRCGRCALHAICRPDVDDCIEATAASCIYARTVLEEVLWLLIDSPELPALLAGQRAR